MKVFTIGRSSSNDIVLNDSYVWSYHCQIVQHDNCAFSLVEKTSDSGFETS